MSFSFDFDFISSLLAMPPDQMLLKIFFLGAWVPIALVFLWGAKELWLEYIQSQWVSEQTYLLLAIDIPRGNAESLKSVENMFTYLAGAHGSINLIDQYWVGKFQLGFSFEIVSIDGYTQFLIRTPSAFKNMVESAIYSVYPDAEISEVNDYTENVPDRFPDSEYDMWGAEFIQAAPDCYPIKTYPAFEDPTSPADATFKDPLASLMDLNSTLRPGEQLWYQILVTPEDFSWTSRGDSEVSRLLKEKVPSKRNFLDGIIDVFMTVLSEIGSIFSMAIHGDVGETKKEDEKDDSLKMMNLKPNEKKRIESIQEKASKVGFRCKIRMIYIAKKEVVNKPKVVNGFVGYMKQFIDLDINNFKPDMEVTATSVSYFFRKSRLSYRQNSVMAGYKNRSTTRGRIPGILNIEELATLWHFPIEAVVRATLIQKAPGRKSEPPTSLPFEESSSPGESNAADFEASGIFEEEVLSNQDEGQAGAIETHHSVSVNDIQEKNKLPDFFDDSEIDDKKNEESEAPGNLPFV